MNMTKIRRPAALLTLLAGLAIPALAVGDYEGSGEFETQVKVRALGAEYDVSNVPFAV
ncbi:hypothetical protein HII36_23115 [Nonomuraea sp. NN258]|uniref:hypothetical protein n=1 Tax=Nonomuraea antri TaxID=2730852 RepID=UPI00156A1C1C|nr:hypothetical protein [Nonomuraea antri]NRQ34700.1 hypothetical protein [Nonomuraea antri]